MPLFDGSVPQTWWVEVQGNGEIAEPNPAAFFQFSPLDYVLDWHQRFRTARHAASAEAIVGPRIWRNSLNRCGEPTTLFLHHRSRKVH